MIHAKISPSTDCEQRPEESECPNGQRGQPGILFEALEDHISIVQTHESVLQQIVLPLRIAESIRKVTGYCCGKQHLLPRGPYLLNEG